LESFKRFRVAAGYGFEVPYDVTLGATLKVAGYRFSGVQRAAWGLDLGAIPYRRGIFSTALVIVNLLPPTFSFEERLEDKWPRRGIAALAAHASRWTVSGQVETAQREDTRFRVGGEMRPAEPLALRAGFNSDGPTFGVGVKYRRLRFDYAFLSASELVSEHRFGLSIDIGKPVELQRRIRDEQLNYEVSVALAKERESQRERLSAEADRHLQSGDWEGAARRLAQLRFLFPENPAYKERLDDVTAKRDSVVAVRVQEARAAAAGVEREAVLLDMMQRQMMDRQWQAALATCDVLETVTLDSAAVRAHKSSARDSLEAGIRRAVDQADTALREGRAALAAGWARVALLYDSTQPAATDLLHRAERLGQMQRTEAALLQADAGSDTARVLARVQDLLQLDSEHPLAHRYLNAYAPSESQPATSIDELMQDSEAWGWYTQGFVEFRQGRYERAIESWEKVAARYPGNEATRKNLEQARLRLQDTPPRDDN
jgi:tetratricopeptide (TPR) repeat protein